MTEQRLCRWVWPLGILSGGSGAPSRCSLALEFIYPAILRSLHILVRVRIARGMEVFMSMGVYESMYLGVAVTPTCVCRAAGG